MSARHCGEPQLPPINKTVLLMEFSFGNIQIISGRASKMRLLWTPICCHSIPMDNHVVFSEGFSLLLESDWSRFAGVATADLAYRHLSGQLVFEVDDIRAFLRRLGAFPEVRMLHEVREHPWGRWAVRFYDPDGHVIEVGESMKVVIKRFLRQGLSVEETARRSEFPESYVCSCLEEMGNETGAL